MSELRHAVVATSLCELTVVARDESIVGVWFPERREFELDALLALEEPAAAETSRLF